MPDIQNAISLIEAGEPRQAADLLEQLAVEMPGYATARVLLARAYERLNDWEPALRAWREAHQIIPNSPVVRRGLERTARKAASRSPMEGSPAGVATSSPGYAEPPTTSRAAQEPESPPRSDLPSWESHDFDVDPEPQQTAAPEPPPAFEPEPPPAFEPEPPPAFETEPTPAFEPEPETSPEDTERPAEGRSHESESAPAPRDDLTELDRLISRLESARIVPRPDPENVPPPDLEDDIEDVVSETLAKIYASQGQFHEAAHVYELLAEQQPEKADEFAVKASEMRSRASEQG